MTVVERLNLSNEGLIRAGCACYTTVAEVERLVEGVKEIIHQNKAQAQGGWLLSKYTQQQRENKLFV